MKFTLLVASCIGMSGNILVKRLDASKYPQPDVVVTPKDTFVSLYDLSQVPKLSPALPRNSQGSVTCNDLNKDTCSWGCSGCLKPSDIVSCPDKQNWAITFDDVIELD